jgi:hypothetical protein
MRRGAMMLSTSVTVFQRVTEIWEYQHAVMITAETFDVAGRSIERGSHLAPDRQSLRPIRPRLFDGDFSAPHANAINQSLFAAIHSIRATIVFANFG